MFGPRHRLQEGEGAGGAGGGAAAGAAGAGAAGAAAGAAGAAGAAAGGAATPPEWLKPFGEHAKVFESFKEPGELATKWTEAQTELTALKSKPAADWRKDVSGDDEAVGKLVARYTDPKALGKALLEANNKIRSGELAKPLAKDATPEQVAEWRAANGIPATQADYWKDLPNGLVVGKEDQAAFDQYGAVLHKHNVSPDAAKEIAATYYKNLEDIAKAERALDDSARLKTTTELRTLWGNDFDANERITETWLDGMGKEGKAMFKDAILPDGSRLWNNRAAREFLAKSARENNPIAHLLPGGGEGDMKSIDGEIADIRKMMADQNSDYWKGPKAEKMQERYKQLITAQGRMKAA